MAAKTLKRSEFSATEYLGIIITILVLLLLMSKRLENSVYLVNEERARKELVNIYKLEQSTKQEKGVYTDKPEFKAAYPYSGILYRVRLDSVKGFVAYAIEAAEIDAFGDNNPGNEYFSIDASRNITEGVFIPK